MIYSFDFLSSFGYNLDLLSLRREIEFENDSCFIELRKIDCRNEERNESVSIKHLKMKLLCLLQSRVNNLGGITFTGQITLILITFIAFDEFTNDLLIVFMIESTLRICYQSHLVTSKASLINCRRLPLQVSCPGNCALCQQ